MLYHKQLFKHKPEEGIYGDCLRACLASIMDLPIEDVPHFYKDDQNERYQDWLSERGYTFIQFIFKDSLDVVLNTVGALNPNIHYMLGGESATGVGHFVVGYNNEIVHDPSQSNAGIIGPMEDGFYWISFLGLKV